MTLQGGYFDMIDNIKGVLISMKFYLNRGY